MWVYHSLPGPSSSPCETIGDSGGLVGPVYQSLPNLRMRISPGSGGFGMVGFTFTIVYHPGDLGGIRPCETFTISGLRH